MSSTKKYLFISNGPKENPEITNQTEVITLNNFSIPCIDAALSIDYDVTIGINRKHAAEMRCRSYSVKFYNAEIYRSPFNLKEVYRAYKNLCRFLQNNSVDVIHCNTPIGGFLGRICGHKYNVRRIIYTAHGFHFYKGAPLLNNILFKSIERFLATKTDAIITINQEDNKAARKFRLKPNGKVYLIPGVGVDCADFEDISVDKELKRRELGISKHDFMIISIGDLNRNKNHKSIIKAIAEAKNPYYHLFICGDGPLKQYLLRLAEKLNISDKVHLIGYRKDIKQLLAISDVFVISSLREGLPRSTMEAMASGLPCIASRIRGNLDLLEDNNGGILVTPKGITEYVNALDTLHANPLLCHKFGVNNLKTIQQFDTSIVKARMKKLYGEILA